MNAAQLRKKRTNLDCVKILVGNNPVFPLHVTPIDRQSQIFRHDPVNVNHLDTRCLEILSKLLQRNVVVKFRPMDEPSRPRKDGRNGIRRGFIALLVFTPVSGNSA